MGVVNSATVSLTNHLMHSAFDPDDPPTRWELYKIRLRHYDGIDLNAVAEYLDNFLGVEIFGSGDQDMTIRSAKPKEAIDLDSAPMPGLSNPYNDLTEYIRPMLERVDPDTVSDSRVMWDAFENRYFRYDSVKFNDGSYHFIRTEIDAQRNVIGPPVVVPNPHIYE